MPNNGRITLCPYYRDEKNLSISCEDIFRRFRWPVQKKRWMDTYCDKDWQSCPHAKSLEKLYESYVEGDTMGNNIKELLHKNKELEKEQRKTASMLGRANKREAEKDKQITELQRKNRYLEDKYISMRKCIEEAKDKEIKMAEEINTISAIHEGIIAYLMSTFAGGSFSKADFDAWTEKYEYVIVADWESVEDPDGTERARIVRYKAEVNEIADRPEGSASEDESAGGEETGTAGCEVEREDIEAEEVQERTLRSCRDKI